MDFEENEIKVLPNVLHVIKQLGRKTGSTFSEIQYAISQIMMELNAPPPNIERLKRTIKNAIEVGLIYETQPGRYQLAYDPLPFKWDANGQIMALPMRRVRKRTKRLQRRPRRKSVRFRRRINAEPNNQQSQPNQIPQKPITKNDNTKNDLTQTKKIRKRSNKSPIPSSSAPEASGKRGDKSGVNEDNAHFNSNCGVPSRDSADNYDSQDSENSTKSTEPYSKDIQSSYIN